MNMKLKILDHEFEVIFTNQSSKDDYLGTTQAKEGKIYIDNKMIEDLQKSTLIHEIIHVIETLFSLDLKENVIDIIAMGIYSLLKNNPDFVKFITSKTQS